MEKNFDQAILKYKDALTYDPHNVFIRLFRMQYLEIWRPAT